MNIRTSYMLAAVLSVVGAFALSPAFALEQSCPDCIESDSAIATKALLNDIPVSVWTDAEVYSHDATIMVDGMVANVRHMIPVTITVISPTNNVVTIDQVDPNSDGTYSTTLNTAGALWKYDGTYTIRVQYGSQDINNKVLVELTGGVPTNIQPMTPPMDCTGNELSIDDHCIPFSITGGSVTGGQINAGTSIVVRISSTESGMITLSPAPSVFRGLELTFVDGEQWDDVKVDGNDITIYFPAGAEEVEIVGKFVVPEFGTIAALILAVAIVSIIAVSARSRLSIMPKY